MGTGHDYKHFVFHNMYEVFDLQLAGEEIANMGIYIHSLFCSFYLQLRSTYQRDDDLPNMIIERNQLPSQVTPIFFGVYQWFVG